MDHRPHRTTLPQRGRMFGRILKVAGWARRAGGYLWVRLALFLVLVFAGWRFPGGLKWLPYLAAFAAGVWAYAGLVRDLPRMLAWGEMAGGMAMRACGHFLRPGWRGWRWVFLGLAALVLGVAAVSAWPTWRYFATTSLREDETLNVIQYTSQGFAKVVGKYSLARNHIFFNLVNSLLPWADAVWPLRARMVSFLAVLGGLAVLVGYGVRRGWAVCGAVVAGFVAVNVFALKSLLEARGYGLIFFFSVLACVAFTEWLRTRVRWWLVVLSVAVVLGTYTLAYFVIFGGVLLLAAFAARPSRATFSAGFLAVAALGMLYLPVLQGVLSVASGYGDDYAGRSTGNFDGLDGFLRGMQFFVPYEVAQVAPWGGLALLCVVLAFAGFGSPRDVRMGVAAAGCGVLCVVVVFMVIGSVPWRAGSFLAGPQAFLGLVITGSVLGARPLRNIRPVLESALALGAVAVLAAVEPSEPLVARQDWRGIARIIEQAFPPDTRVWTAKSYAPLVQWHLKDKRLPESGDLDRDAFAAGRLVALDAEFHNRAEVKRPGYDDFPEGVRFLTIPLLINYNRLYFLPPPPTGIISAIANGKPVRLDVPGLQVPDPDVVPSGIGHGDTLLKNLPADRPRATPDPITLPATLDIRIHPSRDQSRLNLLFERSLTGMDLSTDWQDDRGRWHTASPAIPTGEFVSLPVPSSECREIRLAIRPHKPGTPAQTGLLAAWLTTGNPGRTGHLEER